MNSERGSASMEMTLLTPVLLAILLLVVAGGRLTNARADVDAAVRDGARAASIARSAVQARQEAETVTLAALSTRDVDCNDPQFSVDTSQFRPGGSVIVDVRCDVSLSDLTLLPLPSTQSLHARFVEPVDTYRQVAS